MAPSSVMGRTDPSVLDSDLGNEDFYSLSGGAGNFDDLEEEFQDQLLGHQALLERFQVSPRRTILKAPLARSSQGHSKSRNAICKKNLTLVKGRVVNK